MDFDELLLNRVLKGITPELADSKKRGTLKVVEVFLEGDWNLQRNYGSLIPYLL